jgi:hypothetical protein
MRMRTTFLSLCIAAAAACGDPGLDPVVIGVETGALETGEGDTGGLETGEEATAATAPAKQCWCRGYECVEHNGKGQEVSFYGVDLHTPMNEGDRCEVTQLVKDLLYYECVNSVIHPDWADWAPTVKFTCEVTDA